MRRVVGNHKNGIAGVEADGNVDSAAIGGVYAAGQRERNVGPLVFLDAAVVDGLEKRSHARNRWDGPSNQYADCRDACPPHGSHRRWAPNQSLRGSLRDYDWERSGARPALSVWDR